MPKLTNPDSQRRHLQAAWQTESKTLSSKLGVFLTLDPEILGSFLHIYACQKLITLIAETGVPCLLQSPPARVSILLVRLAQ